MTAHPAENQTDKKGLALSTSEMWPPLRRAFTMNSGRLTTNEEKEQEPFLQHTNRDSSRIRWNNPLSLKWDMEPLLNHVNAGLPHDESPTQTEQQSPVISSSAASLTPCRCYFKYWLRGVMLPFWITSRDHQSHEATLTSLLDRQALKLDRTKVPGAVISYKSWVALADSPRTYQIVCFKPTTLLIHKVSQGPIH